MEKWEEKSKNALPFTMHVLRVVHFLYTAVLSFIQLSTLIRNPPAHTHTEGWSLDSSDPVNRRAVGAAILYLTLLWFSFCLLFHSCYYSGELWDYITRELYTSAHSSEPTPIHLYSKKERMLHVHNSSMNFTLNVPNECARYNTCHLLWLNNDTRTDVLFCWNKVFQKNTTPKPHIWFTLHSFNEAQQPAGGGVSSLCFNVFTWLLSREPKLSLMFEIC